MTKQRRTFTPEFKREASSLVLDQGCKPGSQAHQLARTTFSRKL
ncbi:hypothetical protein [Pseudomonas sp. AP-1]